MVNVYDKGKVRQRQTMSWLIKYFYQLGNLLRFWSEDDKKKPSKKNIVYGRITVIRSDIVYF